MACDEVAGIQHQNERRKHHRESGNDRPQHAACGHIANVGGTVDANRSRCHLRDSHDVGEGLCGDLWAPIFSHHQPLNERQHRISATETEQTDLKICPNEAEVSGDHAFSSFLFCI